MFTLFSKVRRQRGCNLSFTLINMCIPSREKEKGRKEKKNPTQTTQIVLVRAFNQSQTYFHELPSPKQPTPLLRSSFDSAFINIRISHKKKTKKHYHPKRAECSTTRAFPRKPTHSFSFARAFYRDEKTPKPSPPQQY